MPCRIGRAWIGAAALSSALVITSCGTGSDGATTPAPMLTTITVSLPNSSITVGQSITATAAGYDQNGEPMSLGAVTWSTGSQSIATVTSAGGVTGVGPGQTHVIANSGGKQGQQLLTVTSPTAASVTIQPASVTLDVGQSATVTATVRDAAGNVLPSRIVEWLTSNGAVVGGTTNGNTATIQGRSTGSAFITAGVDGVLDTLVVTVRATAPQPVASVVISPSSASITVGSSLPLVATLRDAQGNVLTDRGISWTTTNAAVVSGVAAGNTAFIDALSVGQATIRATSEGITGSSLITVTSSGGGAIPLTCAGVAGGQVLGADGQYLGRLTNQFDSESILNTFGVYGSSFSSTSMYNRFSTYGSIFSSLSAYNTIASSPPLLFVSSRFAAYVSKNTIKIPRVDPDALRTCSFP